MGEPLRGGCACGSDRYAVAAPPAFTLLCKCRQCQRISGSGHAAQFAAPATDAQVHGPLSYYEYTADSGAKVSCGFCPACGNPVLKKPSRFPQFIFFHAATLDAPDQFRPQMVVFGSDGQPWDYVDPSLPLR
jgi:hypothetical protein